MDRPEQHDLTRLLAVSAQGDAEAHEKLIGAVYKELRAVAGRVLKDSARPMQTTALVHEAYLKLFGSSSIAYENRGHFFGAAAEAMRNVIVEHVRSQAAAKRGGGRHRITLDGLALDSGDDPGEDVLALNDAVERLATFDHHIGTIVKLRYFVGLSIEETAAALEVSPTTVKRDWTYARAWLKDHMASNG